MEVRVKMGLIQKLDNYILSTMKKYTNNKYLDIIMPLITHLGTLGILWIAIATMLMLSSPYKLVGAAVIVTLTITTFIGEGIIKHIIRRTRPCNKQNIVNLLISKPSSYSFPSGHTVSSFAAAEILSRYFYEYKLIFMAIAVLIALSRLYLYVHYPTDIIAGIIIGTLCSKFVFILLQEGYIEKLITLIH